MSKLSRLISSTQKGTVCVHNLTALTALGQSTPKVKQIGAVTCSEVQYVFRSPVVVHALLYGLR